MIRTISGVLLIAFFLSCSKNESVGIYNQGRLEYRISYLNAVEDNYDPSFLPKKMILEFNQEYSINRIDGFMGFFKLGNITYFKNRKVKTHLKVLDQNYTFTGGRNDMMCCFDCMDGMIITKDTVKREFAGLRSRKAIISFEDNPDTFEIFFTNDIHLAHPNRSNPYSAIDGVLTRFRLIMGPYDMLFTASKFDPDKAPVEEMEIPEKAMEVNRPEMVAILNRLMEQNM
jgi:hypothetical protein